MKYIILILLLSIFVYYGVKLNGELSKGSGPEMTVSEPLVELVNEWKKDMVDSEIQYSNSFNRIHEILIVEDNILPDGNVAYADLFKHTIHISKSLAYRGRLTTKAALYHELGHYVFYLDHVKDKCLMSKYAYDEDELNKEWNALLKSYLTLCKKHEDYAKL